MLLSALILGLNLCLDPGSAGGLHPAPPVAASGSETGAGKVFLTKEEALKLAFKDCEIERSTVYLTAAQKREVDRLAGFKVKASIAYTYAATRAGKPVGWAWFDVSMVRSKKQSVLFVVGPDRRIARFELLAFAEPLEYIPRPNWYAQLVGKALDKELNLKRGIKSVTGATLTARATVSAARRCLALHNTLIPAVVEEQRESAPERAQVSQ